MFTPGNKDEMLKLEKNFSNERYAPFETHAGYVKLAFCTAKQ